MTDAVQVLPRVGRFQFLTKLDRPSSPGAQQLHDTYIARYHHPQDDALVSSIVDQASSAGQSSSTVDQARSAGQSNSFVVVRVYPLETLFGDQRLRLKLERNHLVLRAANHPHILRSWPSIYTRTDVLTVEEFCEFGELFEVVEKNNEDADMRTIEHITSPSSSTMQPERFSPEGLPVAVVLRLFDELMQAVSCCHDVLGVCHRDIKLEHLFLDRNMSLKLGNFGMSAPIKLAAGCDDNDGDNNIIKGRTAEEPQLLLRVACGSRHYVAPEVLLGEMYDGALSDVWSCGVVLYALVTGGFPLDEDTVDAVGSSSPAPPSASMRQVLPLLSSFQRIRDAAVKEVIRGMLDPEPSTRWTVTQVQQAWARLRRARRAKGT